jgi:hypothetical protein
MSQSPDTYPPGISELHAAIVNVTQAAAMVDDMLAYVVQNIVSFAGRELSLASIIIFSQTTVQRRMDITASIMTLRLRPYLEKPKHSFEYKGATFLQSCFNKISENIRPHLSVRNTAAHGSIHTDPVPNVKPGMTDIEGTRRFYRKKGIKGVEFMPTEVGLVAEEMRASGAAMINNALKYQDIGNLVELMMHLPMNDDTQKILEAKYAELGKDLKLLPPVLERPHRQAKKPR